MTYATRAFAVRVFAAAVLIGGSLSAQTGQDWPQFRGPTGMGISEAKGLPVEWSADQNVVWKTALPGAGSSSPIVFGDHIYLTTYTGYAVPGEAQGSLDDLTRHLVCLDRSSGKVLWNQAVPAKLPEEAQIRDHGYAANTPVADAERVYAFFGKSGVIAFDHQGKQLWQADVGSKTRSWGSSASPILYKDTVIVNASVESQSLVALDKETGEEKWRTGGIREAWNTPVLVTTEKGGLELVVGIPKKVLGFDPDTGEQLWTCNSDITWYIVPSVVAKDGIVYSLGGRSGTAGLRVRSGGRGDVTADRRGWTIKKGSNVTSPVISDDHLYWMSDKLGVAYALHVDTGELQYEERLPRAGQVYASALLAGGRVYYVTRRGQTFVLGAGQGKFELLANNDLRDGGVFDASPAVTGNRLLIRSTKHLYCLGK